MESVAYKGINYIYDGIIIFEATIETDSYIKMRAKNGKRYLFSRDCFIRTKTSQNRIVFFIIKRDERIKTYLDEHMDFLATREGISGQRWDVPIVA